MYIHTEKEIEEIRAQGGKIDEGFRRATRKWAGETIGIACDCGKGGFTAAQKEYLRYLVLSAVSDAVQEIRAMLVMSSGVEVDAADREERG